MTGITIAAVIGVSFFLSAVYAGTETGLYRADRIRLHFARQRNDRRAGRVSDMLRDIEGALYVTILGVNSADYVLTASIAYAMTEAARLPDAAVELYTVAVLGPALFVLGNVVPKSLYHSHANRLLMANSAVIFVSDRLFRWTGLIWLLKSTTALLARALKQETSEPEHYDPRRRVVQLLHEALSGRAEGEDQSNLIHRAFELSELRIDSVMVPWHRVTAISMSAGKRELTRIARETDHARLPVFPAGQSRSIVGTIRIDDLLTSGDFQRVADHLEPAVHLPPAETVAAAIAVLQRKRCEMAVVGTKGGPMLGVVTLRDLLEVVVGGLIEEE